MGAVFLGRNSLHERVAVKVAINTPDAISALTRELAALREIGAPHVPVLFDHGTLPDGVPYIVMELVDAPTLDQRLEALGGPMPLPEFAALALPMCNVVGELHARGFLHIDLKPENIFVFDRAPIIRLLDLGAVVRLTDKTQRDARVGTAEYMPPEQLDQNGILDQRTDLYAVGIIFYEMLTGRPPFFGSKSEVHQAQLGKRPPRPSDYAPIPASVENVLLACLAKDPARRPASLQAMAAQLREAFKDTSAMATPMTSPATGPPTQPKAAARSRPLAILFVEASGNLREMIEKYGGVLAHTAGKRSVVLFGQDGAENPIRHALGCAQALIAQKRCKNVLIDLSTVQVRARPDGARRYASPLFMRADLFARPDDPETVLLTAAAANAVPELATELLAGRESILMMPMAKSESLRAAEDATSFDTRLSSTAPFVGRETIEQTLMLSMKTAFAQRRTTIATVIGAGGQGKTHLATVIRTATKGVSPESKILTLRAREPLGGDTDDTLRELLSLAFNFAPHISLLEAESQVLGILGAELGAEVWPPVALTLGWFLSSDPRLQAFSAAPGALRSSVMRAAGEALRHRAASSPLAIFVDDAQFADRTTLDALEYAALAEAALPLWICVFARPSFDVNHPEWAERAIARERIDLGPLSPENSALLCRKLLRPAENVPAAVVDNLVERTQGVPLLLVELVRALKRENVIRKQGASGAYTLAADELDRFPNLPIVEWLADREINALAPNLRAHARLAALLGGDFVEAEIEGILHELERDGLGDEFPMDARVGVKRLTGNVLIESRGGRISFRNAMLRGAVEKAIPESLRLAVHRAAVRFYQTAEMPDNERLSRLALHAAAADMREEASTLYLTLADGARQRHDYLASETLYSRALELLAETDLPRRMMARRGRGGMRFRIGRYVDAVEDLQAAVDAARALKAVEAEVEILLDLATALDWANDWLRSSELVKEARKRSEGILSPALEARLLLGEGRTGWRYSDWPRAVEQLTTAATKADQIDDYETGIVARLILVYLLPSLGQIDEAERQFEIGLKTALERGDRLHWGAFHPNAQNIYFARRDFSAAVEGNLRYLQIGRELGLLNAEYFAHFNLGEEYYWLGDFDNAWQHINRANEIESRHFDLAGRPCAALLRLRVLTFLGRMDEARAVIDDIRKIQDRHRSQGDSKVEFMPTEQIFFDLAVLLTREECADAEWDLLLARSNECSTNTDPIEVTEMHALWLVRRGRLEDGHRRMQDALALAERIPNYMEPRLRRASQQVREKLAQPR